MLFDGKSSKLTSVLKKSIGILHVIRKICTSEIFKSQKESFINQEFGLYIQ